MRQACARDRFYLAYGGLRAGMQEDVEDQPELPPGWTRSWSYGFNRPIYVHQGPGEGGSPPSPPLGWIRGSYRP
eukprot:14923654-Alexandrium_andersonii.AAC.1